MPGKTLMAGNGASLGLSNGVLIGRDGEMRRLRLALQERQSQLIWGPSGAGKTFLIERLRPGLPEAARRKCMYASAPTGGRDVVAQFIRGFYLAGDLFVRAKVHGDGAQAPALNRWIDAQTSMRLRGILFSAAGRGDYSLFIDHLPPPSPFMAHLIDELMYRCKTPVYFTAHGFSSREIGHAWSLYWCDRYRTQLGPLSESSARALLEICIQSFGLSSLDLQGFRTGILRLSGCLPGPIVKMCELATDPRYHYRSQIKMKLMHVDCLIQTSRDERDPIHPARNAQ